MKKNLIIRGLFCLWITALPWVLAGCCHNYDPNPPTRPVNVEGWKTIKSDTLLTIGSFVLKKGESTNNGKLGVTLIDLKPRILCLGPFAEPSPGEIKLRFFRVSDNQTLCLTTIFAIGENGGGTLDCADKSELPSGFGVRAINYKEGWVWFELSSSVGDQRW
jgi:hypothetical protein